MTLGLNNIGGDLAPTLGANFFFSNQDFRMTFFKEKIPIFMPKISDDLLLVIDHVFQVFPTFFLIFHIFIVSNVIYDPSVKRKNLFHKMISWLHLFSSVGTTLLLKILGGRMHGPSPHLNFFGEPSPSPNLGLHPCLIT